MTTDCNGSEVGISNWTLATGTHPGERHVTMLEIDRELDAIPVATWATGGSQRETDPAMGSPVSADCCAVARA